MNTPSTSTLLLQNKHAVIFGAGAVGTAVAAAPLHRRRHCTSSCIPYLLAYHFQHQQAKELIDIRSLLALVECECWATIGMRLQV